MKKYIILLASTVALSISSALTSCSEFFDVDSDHIIYADKNHLGNATDSIYSLTGILNKLQAIGDRTILFGESRGDLVTVTDKTSSDLRDLAMFNVGNDNIYNNPRDYYAVINNCNYYIANADTAMKNNRDQYLFKAEFAAIKAIRAWTYLQLVTTYGKVPFVTEPIMTKEEAEQAERLPRKGIDEICNYFINEDGLKDLLRVDYPHFGNIKGLPSRLFYIPMSILLADLNLWVGNYREAAEYYYYYISHRNGDYSTYPTGISQCEWQSNNWEPQLVHYVDELGITYENTLANTELIALIPGDSIPSEGYYSQLRNIFNSTDDNDYLPSLVPSQSIIDLSAKQEFCYYDEESDKVTYAPHNLGEYRDGDLRLSSYWYTIDNIVNSSGSKVTYQEIFKHLTRNIHIYRRQLIYLRMAEALNCAGYPHFAYHILSTGVNNRILNDSIIPHYTADSVYLASTFDFPNYRYEIYNPRYPTVSMNTQGIHSRGSGFTQLSEKYPMPYNEAITDSLEQIAWQQKAVEDLLMDEEALEFAFEGYRFYDLMRVARRRGASYLADRVNARNGAEGSGITVDLTNMDNWFISWEGKIGIEP
ncbi:MAG: RagB/SusD family nutrient uptake outer membrane protein [Bacteroidales bacterium]|nr:RagB/SusD family nutrient uptake outer membrane protein [Candidatus Liminaster caballi]